MLHIKKSPPESLTNWALENWEIPATERCSKCIGKAVVAALVPTNRDFADLNFCGHHFDQYEAGLRKAAIRIVDERKPNARL